MFRNPAALLRLAGAVLVEAHDEWQVNDRRYLSEGSMALLRPTPNSPEEVAQPALIASLSNPHNPRRAAPRGGMPPSFEPAR